MTSTANQFGHDRLNPVFLTVDAVKKGGRPPVLTRLAGRLPQLYDMLTKSQWKPLYGFRVSRARTKLRQRQIYSQRREAVVRLLQAMVSSLDLRTMAVICPDSRTRRLEPVTLDWLADRAGLGLKRASRSMADLEAMGLVFVKQRRERSEDGGWRSKASIRRVSTLLFSIFGLGDELAKSRKYKKNRRNLDHERAELVDNRNQTEKARDVLITKNMLEGAGHFSVAKPSQLSELSYSPDPDDTENRRRNVLRQLRTLIDACSNET